MSHLVCPLDILFSLPRDADKCGQDESMPRSRTIGIGDGGNEVESLAPAATCTLSCYLFHVCLYLSLIYYSCFPVPVFCFCHTCHLIGLLINLYPPPVYFIASIVQSKYQYFSFSMVLHSLLLLAVQLYTLLCVDILSSSCLLLFFPLEQSRLIFFYSYEFPGRDGSRL